MSEGGLFYTTLDTRVLVEPRTDSSWAGQDRKLIVCRRRVSRPFD